MFFSDDDEDETTKRLLILESVSKGENVYILVLWVWVCVLVRWRKTRLWNVFATFS